MNFPMISRTSLAALAFASSASAQDIEVRQLGALDPLEVQIADTPLESDLWQGSSLATASAAISALPDRVCSSQGASRPRVDGAIRRWPPFGLIVHSPRQERR